ncbi:fibronectin type III domain-containing protein [Catellatospora sp. NPDC049609]|uniref:fibronectin type III domain-containing protein n=1 Tax=Catellatospora sp. NPDC049609 TaxID=3155505 RepID=UPI00344A20F2
MRRRRHTTGLALAGILIGLLTAPGVRPAAAAAAPPAGGMTGAQLTQLFAGYGNTSGRWSGADSTASVLLPDGRVAWLFSDTMIGTVNADFSRPRSSPMINNSLVVQDGAALTSTVHGGSAAAPQSLIPSAVSGEWYWIADATVEAGTMKVLVNRYRKTGDGGLDFALTGTALASMALPGLTVSSVTELPLGDTVAWGAALLEDGGYTYIYGSEYVAADAMRFARLARVPAGGLSGAWQYWTGSGWSASATASARLPLSGVGTAFGVQKIGSQYVVVTMESNTPFAAHAVAYTAGSPTGPFSDPVELFTAPEPAQREGVIVYDARVHPHLAPNGKLLVSYNVHSLVSEDLYADARIYRPRFVDVTWPVPAPDPAAVPAAPAGLTAAGDPTGAVSLTWPAVSGSGVTYTVYQRDVTAGQTHFARVASPTGANQTLGGFRTGHTYEFRVTARNAAGEGLPSVVRSVAVTIAAPPAPSGLTAVAGSDGTIALNWGAVPYAWRYDVVRRDVTAGETAFSAVNDANPGDTTLSVTWLAHNHEYEFAVTASHGGGTSPQSAAVRATARYALPPTPTGLTAVAQGNGTIRLTWSGPASNVYYLMFQRDVTAGETTFTQLPLPLSCCELAAGYLAHGHEYEFKVVASNSGGESAASNLARAVSSYPLPAAPGTLSAVAGNGQVQLTWGASSSPDTWYWVYQRDVTAGEPAFTRLPIPISTCCTMTAGYLANGHVYEFKVTSTNQAGESAASNTVTATPRRPLPGQVTGLTVTSLSSGELRLNWTAPDTDLYYWVYQRDVTAGETAFTKLSLPVGTCCTFAAGLLTHGHVYEFKVAGTNQTGDGPASAAVRGTSNYAKPPAPANLRATAAGDGSIDLDWDATAGNVLYWIYSRDVTGGQSFTKSAYPTARTSASLGWLVHGHVYEFKVTAENQGGEGPATAAVRATATGGLPQAPSGLTATAGDGQVTLRWTASGTANVYYWIEQRVAGGTWQRLQYPLSTCCVFTATLLANGTTYEFRVRANNVHGDSAASNVASARPLPPLPQPPTGLIAIVGDGQITLRWTASPTPNVYYWVEQRPAGGTWQRLPLPVTTCCQFTAGLLSNGTYYEFRLRATNLAGDSAASVAAGARPMPPLPQAPSGLSVSAQGDTAARLTWTASSTGSVYYWIFYRIAGQSAWTKAQYPLSTCCAFTMSMLNPGKRYEFHLKAENLTGMSGASNTAAVTLTITAPGRPNGVKAVPRTDSSDVDVSWNAVANATGYTVEAQVCKTSTWYRVGFMLTGTTHRVGGAAGCYTYRVVADRFGVYGPDSTETVLAFGTVDDYPWKGGWSPIDRYGFWRKQCTSFVASRVWRHYPNPDPPGFVVSNYWHAKNWDEAAPKHGGAVWTTPVVGSIAQHSRGDYGHVAWVAGIDGAYVIIEEYNGVNSEAYSRRRVLASSFDTYLTVM